MKTSAEKPHSEVNLMQESETKSFHLTMVFDRQSSFGPLLQAGFRIRVTVGCTLRDLLCEQFGLASDYVENNILTIFLNGRPVDNLEYTIVEEGATLALSAAMPGLIGATMRRGGYYAALRDAISSRKTYERFQWKKGTISLKLFNTIADDLGAVFLEQGISTTKTLLHHYLQTRPPEYWSSCREVIINGEQTTPQRLMEMDWPSLPEQIELRALNQAGSLQNNRF